MEVDHTAAVQTWSQVTQANSGELRWTQVNSCKLPVDGLCVSKVKNINFLCIRSFKLSMQAITQLLWLSCHRCNVYVVIQVNSDVADPGFGPGAFRFISEQMAFHVQQRGTSSYSPPDWTHLRSHLSVHLGGPQTTPEAVRPQEIHIRLYLSTLDPHQTPVSGLQGHPCSR